MDIKKFHELYWGDKTNQITGWMSYSVRPQERNHNSKANFDPHYSTLFDKGGAREIERFYDKYDYVQSFHGKKFVLGDYTFYGYAGQKEYSEFHKGETTTAFTFIMDYHGYRKYIMYFQHYIYDERAERYHVGNYGKSYEGTQEFLDLLNNFDGDLIDYDVNMFIDKEDKKNMVLKPSYYLSTKNYKTIGEIDFDHFVLMETKDGIYKPSTEVTSKILNWEYARILKGKTPKLADLGIHTVQMRNNTAFSINEYYNLEGVEIKASKSILKGYPKLQKYSKNDDLKAKIKIEEDLAKKQRELEIYNDSYTLSQHGKVILENARSHEIANYFANKEYKDFELGIIDAAKKIFEVAPEMTKIFFMNYGIHTYTELAGNKFASDFEGFESINKIKGITIPKRIVTLMYNGVIEAPSFDTNDSIFKFERGATYIGAKLKNGKVVMITESGDEGL